MKTPEGATGRTDSYCRSLQAHSSVSAVVSVSPGRGHWTHARSLSRSVKTPEGPPDARTTNAVISETPKGPLDVRCGLNTAAVGETPEGATGRASGAAVVSETRRGHWTHLGCVISETPEGATGCTGSRT